MHKINIFYNGFYKHCHNDELQALENVVQTPPNGPFNQEDLLWEVVIQHTRMQQGPHLVEVAFNLTTWMFDFITSEEGKDGGRCCFFCKKCIINIDNDLQQLQIDDVFEFSRFEI